MVMPSSLPRLVTLLFPFAECALSVLLFALCVGLVRGMTAIVRTISTKLVGRAGDEPAPPRLVELDNEIAEINQRMSALSPTAEFAQYFKLERIANKLGEERKKIASRRKISPTYSQPFALGLRAMAFFISLALALHSSADTRLFSICSDHFYPFNFLLDFPLSIVANFQWAAAAADTEQKSFSNYQTVGLFSFSILSLFTWNCWQNARLEMSKKAE